MGSTNSSKPQKHDNSATKKIEKLKKANLHVKGKETLCKSRKRKNPILLIT